ncbi:PREDICTED: protein msta, isoform B-like isoform X1 [Polistes dominula]|uniref:Protein msta, isoform B-like isoform X1 n=1 Tax=Polistes dominula TaxID=743375 RepID=A0ABM1IE13_POLDO|nr:PREDICTED: protein msta, isoform B-like isoform X1 [Polistes dominula]
MQEENVKEGECSVCGKSAKLKCSDCRRSFYCNKEHQKEDWPRHKSICHAWEIKENEEVGRYLVANRDLTSGEAIISEVPLVWGAAPHTHNRVCIGCGSRCEYIETRCTKCLWPSCSINCQALFAKDGHELECALLAKTRIFPRCDVLLAIRMLILWKTKSKRWKLLEKLQSHENARGPGTEAYEEVQEVKKHLGPLIEVDPSCAKILPKICGLIDVNALETIPPEGSVAIYRTACLLEHRCLANTRHSFTLDEKGRPIITVTAVTSIKKGEHLSTNYTHALWSTRARRQHLLATKYFSCTCERCADPTELGTHLGTLKCPYNDAGLVLPRDPLDFETEWSCNKCQGTLQASEVIQLTDRLEEEVEEAMRSPNKAALSDLLSRLRALLHPGHQHCISLGHSLIQLLPSRDPLKLELCKLIMNTVAAIDPYYARLTLYAAITLRELAYCPGQDKKAHLSKAATLLMSEPPKSPGAKLLRLINSELKYA